MNNPKVRRGGIEPKAVDGSGPEKKEIYSRRDSDGFRVEVRVAEFPDDGRGEGAWAEVENQIPKDTASPGVNVPKMVRMLQYPAAHLKRSRRDLLVEETDGPAPEFIDIPGLVKELRDSGFSLAQTKWPQAFDLLLKILEPQVYRALRPYCREKLRFLMTKELWRLVYGEIWRLATLHPPEVVAARKFWAERLDAMARRLLLPKMPTDEAKPETIWEPDPKSPADWLGDNLRYGSEVDLICKQYGVFGTDRAWVRARADEVFSKYYFGVVKKCSTFQLAKEAEPWPIADFECKVFYPAMREALRITFPKGERPGLPGVVNLGAAESSVRFQEILKKGVQERFNGLRSQRRAHKTVSGNERRAFTGAGDDAESEGSGQIGEIFDSYEGVPSDFVEKPGREEIKRLCRAMPKSGRTLREFEKILDKLPAHFGIRAAKTEAYRRLSVVWGIKEATLRKQICQAHRFLKKQRISCKTVVSEESLPTGGGNGLAHVAGCRNGTQPCPDQELNRDLMSGRISVPASVHMGLTDECDRKPYPGGEVGEDRSATRHRFAQEGFGGGAGNRNQPRPLRKI